jgi:tetratricopeptide (TPR) repeat protein
VIGPTACRAAGIVMAAILMGSACASGRPSNRFIKYGHKNGTIELMESPHREHAIPEAAVQEAIARARRERGPAAAALPTIESTNADLRDALRDLSKRSSAAAHLRVAHAYSRLGVGDMALDHFDRAIRQNGRLAAAYDGRARIWRDWHMPGFAVGDAYRAVKLAPRSPEAQNTLGTVLLLTGNCRGARTAFERALLLQPGARYAARNLARVRSIGESATGGCGQAAPAPRPRRLSRVNSSPRAAGAR